MNICIAENLNLLRQRNGYTLESLAEIISVSRQTVAKWETGDSSPDITNCVKLANLYKISLDELVNRPLREAINCNFSDKEELVCGVLDISETGSIQLPDALMKMFDLQYGGKLLLLADKRQGMALVKCSQF